MAYPFVEFKTKGCLLEQAEKGYAGGRETYWGKRIKGNLLRGVGAVCAGEDPGSLAGFIGTRGEAMAGAGEKRAQGKGGRAAGLSQRLRQAAPIGDEFRDHRDPAAPGERLERAI